jgi:agmatinase
MAKFVTDVFEEEDANVVVVGVDCPASLREESQMTEIFDIDGRANLLDGIRIYDDDKNVKMSVAGKKVAGILKDKKLPLALAKLHTVTLHVMKEMPDNVKLVVFDAHPDLKDEYEGSKYSHACWLRRWVELDSGNIKRVMLLGVRSTDEDEFAFMKDSGIPYFTANKIMDDLESVKKRLKDFVGDCPVYVSLDMDFFDPSIAPAVKYPEPGGIIYRDFLSFIEAMRGAKLAGVDCVEIRPIKGNRITESLAVMSLFKLLSIIT